MLTADHVGDLVRKELERIADPALLARTRELLVDPYPVDRAWDYGAEGDVMTCWTVLEHPSSNSGIVYCPEGFGPANPWGLVFLTGDHSGIGMDCSWYLSLESAMVESMAWDGHKPEDYEVP